MMTKILEIQNLIVEQVTEQFISNHMIDIDQDLGIDGYNINLFLIQLMFSSVIFQIYITLCITIWKT